MVTTKKGLNHGFCVLFCVLDFLFISLWFCGFFRWVLKISFELCLGYF